MIDIKRIARQVITDEAKAIQGLADFIDDAETLNAATIQRHENMRKIAGIYNTLHNSHIRLRNEFNIFHEIEKYDNLIKNVKAEMYHGWEDIRHRVMELEIYLNTIGIDLKPCHNDALYENFIKSSVFATKSVSQFISTIAPFFKSSDI